MNSISGTNILPLLSCAIDIVNKWADVEIEGQAINKQDFENKCAESMKFSYPPKLFEKMKDYFLSNVAFQPHRADFYGKEGTLRRACIIVNKKMFPEFRYQKEQFFTQVDFSEMCWIVVNGYMQSKKVEIDLKNKTFLSNLSFDLAKDKIQVIHNLVLRLIDELIAKEKSKERNSTIDFIIKEMKEFKMIKIEELKALWQNTYQDIQNAVDKRWSEMEPEEISKKVEQMCLNTKIPHFYFEIWSQIHYPQIPLPHFSRN